MILFLFFIYVVVDIRFKVYSRGLRLKVLKYVFIFEEVQGATTSSHIPPPLLQDLWPFIQLLHAERHAP